jgi:hypothetical protein
MKKFFFYTVFGTLMLFNCNSAQASVQTDIEQANKAGKTVFLVVTEPGIKETVQALDIAREAQKLAPETTVLEMNRADLSNSLFIATNRLAEAPLPLIVLIASNGVLAGGLTAEKANPDRLVQMIPSPGKAEVVKALGAGKAVFVIASRATMGDRLKMLETCKNASKKLNDKAVSVAIDMDDKKETTFLQQLQVDMAYPATAVFVLNAQGQLTGNFAGPVEVAELTKAAIAKGGGCGPGRKGCGPASKGCGPRR